MCGCIQSASICPSRPCAFSLASWQHLAGREQSTRWRLLTAGRQALRQRFGRLRGVEAANRKDEVFNGTFSDAYAVVTDEARAACPPGSLLAQT